MIDHNQSLRDLLARAPVIPVLTFETPEEAIAISGALIDGGLDVLEVTLRTPRALEVIAALASEFPDAWVGAGTVLAIEQARAAQEAGARFLVSPGSTETLLREGADFPLPWLHAAVTASEVMRLREHGRRVLKFFPAEQAGGAAVLKAWAPVLQDVMFCPTGGVDAAKAPAYLALPNVGAVGGSWIVPADAVKARDLARITDLARAAKALRP
ncbi:bifunctional 4-hydroxy-2-oxoglutarate aldolase/2-dehydro-3-deoxy-phosphogluconate aldolase [Terrihabitans rhizophilus]|uniref:2-dehydro-3-deoxy-phosphogluconate aldolase n=1 Tax=Terrihabitans rhizophilus TaxID=3092662 RepID=A0ABU4RQ18_9HYPH|nr:bifunctional 4-hydroxy-2-oxoglutarate aldolase/2-dehydro-3-deoxy-phosphogluconate aldolase [Terrihabitans sp. PJ23]MDX6806199.1 bifunctional 4-hydroxy-2-oxoglutarate aldolase/2-dehydro-3-deoxy-phosphogluconate aldolase [Terrihabitans sp. PJ23]